MRMAIDMLLNAEEMRNSILSPDFLKYEYIACGSHARNIVNGRRVFVLF